MPSEETVGVHERAVHAPALARWVRQWAPQIVLALAVVIRIPDVFQPITYRNDIWRQADTASIARNFVGAPNILFPRINWGGAGPGYVESEFQLYPWLVSRLYVLFGEHVWLGRIVSLIFATIAMWFLWKVAERLLPRRAALVALVFFSVCPLLLRYSTAFMPEATTMAAYAAALWLFLRWLDDRRWSSACACATATAVAALVKPTALHILVTFAVVLLIRREWRRAFSWQALVFGVIALVPVALWLRHGVALHTVYGNTFGVISGGDSKFGNLSYWTSPTFYLGTARIDLIWIFAVGALPLAVIGLVVACRNWSVPLIPAGVVATAIYDLGVARYVEGDLGIQYHVFATTYAALAVGLGAHVAADYVAARRARWRWVGLLAGVSALVFLCGSIVGYYDQLRVYGTDALRCGAVIRTVIPASDLVVIASTDVAFDNRVPNNYQDPTLFYYGDRRGWSLAADQDAPTLVTSYQGSGARWLITTPASAAGNPSIATFLAQEGLVSSGGGADCSIYHLR